MMIVLNFLTPKIKYERCKQRLFFTSLFSNWIVLFSFINFYFISYIEEEELRKEIQNDASKDIFFFSGLN